MMEPLLVVSAPLRPLYRPPPRPVAVLPDTVLLVSVAALPVPGAATSAFESSPPVPEAVLLVRAHR